MNVGTATSCLKLSEVTCPTALKQTLSRTQQGWTSATRNCEYFLPLEGLSHHYG